MRKVVITRTIEVATGKKKGRKSKGKGFSDSQQVDLRETPDKGRADENISFIWPQRSEKVYHHQRTDMSSPPRLLEIAVQKTSTFDATPRKTVETCLELCQRKTLRLMTLETR